MESPSPKAPTPIRKAVIIRIWETLLEASILIGQMLLCVAILILKKTCIAVILPLILICERILRRSLLPLIRFIILSPVKWEGAFVISCIALSLDPLFFYIPIIDETNKCLAVDKKLRNAAVVLRLLTDIPLTVHFVAQLCGKVNTDYPNLSDSDSDHSNSDSNPDASSDSDFETPACSLKYVKMSWLSVSVVMNFLAVLPIPQVVIIIGFFRIRDSSGTEVFLQSTFLNVSLVLQYLPRVCQIYLSSQHFRMGGIWIQPSLNMLLYIIAGHVFSAFWYFFAIERETSCWHHVCRNTPGCVATFDCSGIGNTSVNMTVLNQLCPINSPNTTIFDFGIYLPILQSGNTGAVIFSRKLFYSLWWGLRNLSFGTNLETSSYMWENCFAILICISGLLLFLCLIGNAQKYMEFATTKSLKSEQSRRKKIAEKKNQIKAWMSSNGVSIMRINGFPVNMRKRIRNYIKEHRIVEKDIKAAVDLKYFLADNRFSMYRIRDPLKEFLVKHALKSVLMLKKMDESGWKTLCRYMEPVIYSEKENIVEKAGQKLDQMIFIIQGEIECTNTINSHPDQLKKGDCYGKSIQSWAAMNYKKSYYDPLPTSTGWVRCQTKVEAFALMASDLLRFLQENLNHLNISSEQLEELAVNHHISTHHQRHNQYDLHTIEPWKRPDGGLVKLNFTVVWNSISKKAKMGYVCRNDQGVFMVAGSSCASPPFNDSFLADAWGMSKAIEFFQQNVKLQAGKGIVVESDNQDLIDCFDRYLPLTSNIRISETLFPVLKSILDLASKFKPIYFMYCNRLSNTVANVLANHAVDSDDRDSAFCGAPPNWLLPYLKEDSLDLDTQLDEELGLNNDFRVTSPHSEAHDYEDIYTMIAENTHA